MKFSRPMWWFILPIALIVASVALSVGLNRWEQNDPQAAQDWWLGVERRDDATVYNAEITYAPATGRWTCGEQEWEDEPVPTWADTLMNTGCGFTCTLRIFGFEDFTAYGHPLKQVNVGNQASVISVSPSGNDYTDVNGIRQYGWNVSFTVASGFYDITSFFMPGDEEWHEYDIQVNYTALVQEQRTDGSIGVKGTTCAKERAGADRWVIDPEGLISFTFGTYSTNYQPTSPITISMGFGFYQTVEISSTDPSFSNLAIAQLTNIAFNGAAVNAGRLKYFNEGTVHGGSHVKGEGVWWRGDGSTISTEVDDWPGTTSGISWSGIINAPTTHAFAIAEEDLDETDIPDALVVCTGIQVYDEEEEAWAAMQHTAAEWRALGTVVPDWGLYSWDATPPPDGAIRTVTPVSFYEVLEDAQERLRDGFDVESVGTPSFDDDATWEIDGWFLDATSRTESPYKTNIVTVTHRAEVSVFGPEPAVALDDLVGSGGVASPDATGAFAVTGDGALTVPIPNSRAARFAKVPLLTAPEGVPGITYVHRADHYYPADGDPEGVYCGRGWPCLKFTFDVAPADDTLTVTLAGHTDVFSDNHLSDSTRQTEFTVTPTPFSYEYTVVLEDGIGYAYLAVPNDGTIDPDLEVVESITIEGLSAGDWKIGAPQWALDPNEEITNHYELKFFESYGYRDGGLSARVDSVVRCALMDTTEANGGHDNTVETNTLRNFNYVVGAESGIDFTTAISLETAVAYVNACSDAWEATYDEDAAATATVDADDTALCTLSVTDLKPIVKHTAAALPVANRVEKWGVVGGMAYKWYIRKLVQGAIRGAAESGGELARGANVEKVWRQPVGSSPAEWGEFDAPVSDAAGFWTSKSGEVYQAYDPEAVLFEYGIGNVVTDVSSTGRFAVREYDYMGTSVVGSAGGRFCLHLLMASSRLAHFYSDGAGVSHIFSTPEDGYWTNPSQVNPGHDNPHRDTTNSVDDHPSATYNADGRLRLFFIRGGDAYMQYSNDMGENWSEATVVLEGYDRGFFWKDGHDASPRINFVGVKSDGTVWYTYSADGATTFDDAVQVASGAAVLQPSGITAFSGKLLVMFSDGSEEVLYHSDDGGMTWQEA